MENQIEQTAHIQKFITKGTRVLLKKENEKSFVRLRFNNTDTDGTQKWRIIVNGNEFYASEVVVKCPTRTFTEKFEDVGIKHHIVCDCDQVEFENNIAIIE
jgi:hypothetical protein